MRSIQSRPQKHRQRNRDAEVIGSGGELAPVAVPLDAKEKNEPKPQCQRHGNDELHARLVIIKFEAAVFSDACHAFIFMSYTSSSHFGLFFVCGLRPFHGRFALIHYDFPDDLVCAVHIMVPRIRARRVVITPSISSRRLPPDNG
jgi:hypothetical protein